MSVYMVVVTNEHHDNPLQVGILPREHSGIGMNTAIVANRAHK